MICVMAESDAKLLLKNVATALFPLTVEQTKELIVYFGIELKVITDIEATNKGSSSIKLHSIQAWLDRDTEASWGEIVTALEQIGMKVIARQIAAKHCPHLLSSSTPSHGLHQPATVHTPQPVNALAALTPAIPSHTVTTPAIESISTHSQPTKTTPTIISDQSYSIASDHALPKPHSTSPASNTTSPSQAVITPDQSLVSSPPSQPSTVIFWSLEKVKATILQLEELFADLQADAQVEIAERENDNKAFLPRFRSRLLLLPVAKRAPHVKFFNQFRKEIISAKNTDTILAILCTHIDYRNYEILFHLVTIGSVVFHCRRI